MKKAGVFVILFLVLLSTTSFVFAANGNNCTTNNDCDVGSVCNSGTCEVSASSTATPTTQISTNKIDKGFACLEKMANNCTNLKTQDLALTILATPNKIFDNCVKELKSRETSDNWGSIKDTALAILALKHAGKTTTASENWILKQEQTPSDLVWYIQEDSHNATKCNIAYKGQSYTINIETNKKIDSNAGECLTLAQSNFWLKISNKCYNNNYTIECNNNFIANLLYKDRNSPTIYVLDETASSPAFSSITLNVKSKCFGTSGSCDYEATEWATLALLKTGHDISEFVPYIISMSDSNKQYLPSSFIYSITNYNNYATQLIEKQKLGNYWEAKNSANGKFYDTSIAITSLGDSSSEQVTKAKSWLLFSQGANGCWQNSVKDTAVALWALAGRTGKSPTTGNDIAYCSESNYFCIPSSNCPSSENVGSNYFCPSLSDTCCTNENLKNCSTQNGEVCNSSEICVGNEVKALDTSQCCTGECKEKPQQTECAAASYNCMDECSSYQESVTNYSCNQGQICCKTKTTTTTKTNSHWWIWVLIILILVTAGAIGYVYREKLKLLWFQLKTKFKKDKGKGNSGIGGPGFPPRPGMPPRPGFPPIRRMRAPIPRARPRLHRDEAMDNTFKKLREMSR